MAQLVTENPKLFSKSTYQELSESVVKVSGNSKFTRLDVREQCMRLLFFSDQPLMNNTNYWRLHLKYDCAAIIT